MYIYTRNISRTQIVMESIYHYGLIDWKLAFIPMCFSEISPPEVCPWGILQQWQFIRFLKKKGERRTAVGGKAHSLNQFKLARCRKMSPFFLPRLWVRKTKSPFSLIIHVCKWSYFCSSQSDVLSFCRRIPSVEQIRRNSLGDSKGQTGNNLIHPRLSYDNWCTGFVEFFKKNTKKYR